MNFPLASLARPPARHPLGGGLSLCRSSGRLCISTHPSATASLRSPFPSARRPRSRLGNPARLRRSGGRHRVRQSSSPPVQARCSAATFPVSSPPRVHPCPANGGNPMFPVSSIGVNRPGFVPRRAGSRLVVLISHKVQKEAATVPEASGGGRCRKAHNLCFPTERPFPGRLRRSSW